MTGSDTTTLTTAFYEHIEATTRLIRVALELEWTIFTRFVVGVILGTFLTVLYLLFTLRNTRQPLTTWERLNKPVVKLFRPWIFSLLLGHADPYAKSIGKLGQLGRDRPFVDGPIRFAHIHLFSWFLYRYYACKFYSFTPCFLPLLLSTFRFFLVGPQAQPQSV